MKTNISSIVVPNLEGARVIGSLSGKDTTNGGFFYAAILFDNGYFLEHGQDPFQDSYWRYSTVADIRERLRVSETRLLEIARDRYGQDYTDALGAQHVESVRKSDPLQKEVNLQFLLDLYDEEKPKR